MTPGGLQVPASYQPHGLRPSGQAYGPHVAPHPRPRSKAHGLHVALRVRTLLSLGIRAACRARCTPRDITPGPQVPASYQPNGLRPSGRVRATHRTRPTHTPALRPGVRAACRTGCCSRARAYAWLVLPAVRARTHVPSPRVSFAASNPACRRTDLLRSGSPYGCLSRHAGGLLRLYPVCTGAPVVPGQQPAGGVAGVRVRGHPRTWRTGWCCRARRTGSCGVPGVRLLLGSDVSAARVSPGVWLLVAWLLG
jgi:hypothetical protein